MKRITLRQAVEAIRNKEAFKAGALSGGYVRCPEAYVVKSYNTVMATYVAGAWHTDDRKYSVTTSKHQSIVRQAIGDV